MRKKTWMLNLLAVGLVVMMSGCSVICTNEGCMVESVPKDLWKFDLQAPNTKLNIFFDLFKTVEVLGGKSIAMIKGAFSPLSFLFPSVTTTPAATP